MKLTAARPNPELQLRASSTRARFFLKYCPSIAVLLSRIIQMPNAERHNFKICLHTQLKGKIFKDMTSYNIHFAIELGKILYLQITAP